MHLSTTFFLLVLGLFSNGFSHSPESKGFRICVPEKFIEDCMLMQTELAGKGGSINIECVHANDKIGCIEKVARDEADFLPLEPEEIYVANQFRKSAFGIIAEIRSTEFKYRDFRYEPVAVVRNSARIRSISDLKGKRSCHTGFGRNAGWKVPFSHLLDKGELADLCEETDAPTVERDMYAFAKYFGSACAPGKWVPEEDFDRSLKQKYSQLCKLCKSSDCSDKDGDGYIGYSGALMCLTQNDGDIAWTKMDAVEKHFQLKDGYAIPIASQFSFLCWNGTSVPLTSTNPCSWARRPWQAIVASTRSSISVSKLQAQLNIATADTNAKWISTVLEMSADSELYHYPEDRIYSPINYLGRGNYDVTLQKPSCPSKNVRICVESGLAQQKCIGLRMAATGRRLSPTFECILSDNNCIATIKQGKADIMFANAKDADMASKEGMQVILSEVESTIFNGPQTGAFRFAVAVVRSDSSIMDLSDLHGKKSCHGSISSLAGWNIPLKVLRDKKLISGPDCQLSVSLASFFNESCVPGALDKRLHMPWLPKSLCKICAGYASEGSCKNNEDELYYGDQGALNCLKNKVADVAFIDHVILNTPDLEKQTGLKANEIQLLCSSGGRQEYTEFHHCNLGKVPTRKIIARSGESYAVGREDARQVLLKASDLFKPKSKNEPIFRLFGPFYGATNVLVQDTSVGLIDDREHSPVDGSLIQQFDYCTTSSANTKNTYTKLTLLSFVPLLSIKAFLSKSYSEFSLQFFLTLPCPNLKANSPKYIVDILIDWTLNYAHFPI